MAVAGGVESRADLQALVAMGCDFGQGFHLGMPLPASDVGPWLAARVVAAGR